MGRDPCCRHAIAGPLEVDRQRAADSTAGSSPVIADNRGEIRWPTAARSSPVALRDIAGDDGG